MRILFINNGFPPEYIGGAEISAFYSAYGLRARGHDCSVLVVHARQPTAAEQDYVFKGIPVHKVIYDHRAASAWEQLYEPAVYHAVRTYLEQARPELVHVHNVSGMSLAPFLACRHLGVPTVVTLHDYWMICPNNMLLKADLSLCDPTDAPNWCRDCYRRYDFWGAVPFRRQVIRWFTQDVRLFISPSQRLVELHAAAGYDPARFRVLKSGIDLGLFQLPTSPAVQEMIRENLGYSTALFAGHIVEIKGLEVLAEALPLLRRGVPDFRLLVAGAGDQHLLDRLQGAAPGAVCLLGKLPFYELRAIYTAAKLTLVPSIWYDNSPIVIYESLLMGTPVLGARIGGIPELVREGETGYLFTPGDAHDLVAKAVAHFARPAPERRRMHRRCLEYAHENLTLAQHMDRLLGIYEEVLAA